MIRIKPEPEIQFTCLKCSHQAAMTGIIMPSAFTLAECKCKHCGFEFYQSLPVGHTATDTLIIDKSDRTLYPSGFEKSWLSKALLKAIGNEKQEEVQIKKIVHKRCDRVVVLNVLDFLYGHVLLKLYNAIYHLDNLKDLGLIVIAPKSFEWLIPKGCAEVWIVDLNLSKLVYYYSHIQKFLLKEFDRFETIYLSNAYSHPDFSTIDISRLTGVKPFALANFLSTKPTFTFVLREDRWWWKSWTDHWLYRICRKLGLLKTGSVLLSMRQNGLIKKTISLIEKKIPDADFYVVGLGQTGNFKAPAHDERRTAVDSVVETAWCKIYARSHVVIGVHGSNMLLPSAHAAGCVEILPEDRYGNIVQDISVRYTDRRQLYFYRFAEQYAQPKTIAAKAVSIIENFSVFERNMCAHIYRQPQKSQTEDTLSDDIYAFR